MYTIRKIRVVQGLLVLIFLALFVNLFAESDPPTTPTPTSSDSVSIEDTDASDATKLEDRPYMLDLALHVGFPFVGGSYADVTSERIPLGNLEGRFHFDFLDLEGLIATVGGMVFMYDLQDGHVPLPNRNYQVVHIPLYIAGGYEPHFGNRLSIGLLMGFGLDINRVTQQEISSVGSNLFMMPHVRVGFAVLDRLQIEFIYRTHILYDPGSLKIFHFITLGASYAVF
jgi:hypothetical protein